jgi:L-asparaginase
MKYIAYLKENYSLIFKIGAKCAPMKKILFIATGGTFASGKSQNGLRPKFSAEQLLKFFPAAREIAEISAVQIFNLDSTNVGPENWEKIAATIFENYEKFDGFVVAHGTDTMHFSAAAAAFALQNLQKPVVFTGSVLSPENPNSDAERNFIDSLLVARAGDVREVCICFGGEILHGVNSRKVFNGSTKFRPENLHIFENVGALNLGKIADEKVKINFQNSPRENLPLKIFEKFAPEEIAILKIFPGLSGCHNYSN